MPRNSDEIVKPEPKPTTVESGMPGSRVIEEPVVKPEVTADGSDEIPTLSENPLHYEQADNQSGETQRIIDHGNDGRVLLLVVFFPKEPRRVSILAQRQERATRGIGQRAAKRCIARLWTALRRRVQTL